MIGGLQVRVDGVAIVPVLPIRDLRVGTAVVTLLGVVTGRERMGHRQGQ